MIDLILHFGLEIDRTRPAHADLKGDASRSSVIPQRYKQNILRARLSMTQKYVLIIVSVSSIIVQRECLRAHPQIIAIIEIRIGAKCALGNAWHQSQYLRMLECMMFRNSENIPVEMERLSEVLSSAFSIPNNIENNDLFRRKHVTACFVYDSSLHDTPT